MRHARIIRLRKPKRFTLGELYRLYRWYRFNNYTRIEAMRKAWEKWK